jgi:hypothetical protein
MEERHGLTFEIFEEGKITLDEYMSLVVFYLNYAHGHLATPENPVLQQ